ncbi:MAG: ATP-dependent helicase, partial [Rhodoferax sp.]|nr:ATP-dependent helicase [Actinomycetota bacterium]
AHALRQRQAGQQAERRSRGAAVKDDPPVAVAAHREVAALRKELHQLVGAWARRTGQPHASVHAELRRACGGPPVPQAGAEQVRTRIDTLRRWFVGRT